MKNRFYSFASRYSLLLLASLVCCFCIGCVNLKPRADITQHYALGSDLAVLTVPPALRAAIYIARPNLPSYSSDSHLQYRSANGEISQLNHARWIEAVDQGIARSMAEMMLGAAGPAGQQVIGYYPWPQDKRSAVQLKVNFYRFGANANGAVEVSAHWEWLDVGGAVEYQGQFTAQGIEWQVGDAVSLVCGLNQALRALIVEVLQSRNAPL